MLATLVIVFREVIEAGLIVGLVLAATRGVPRRGRYVTGGLLAGLAGACLVAAFAGTLGEALEGAGQEVFNAGVMALAVVMLGWHNIWMTRHGRLIAAEMKTVGAEVREGHRSLGALAVVVALAVLREGSEVVLFLYGVFVSGGTGVGAMLLGGTLGLVAGAAVSALMFFGLLRIPARHLFRVTGILIALLAAGMAAQGIAFLQQAGWLATWNAPLWDSSGLLPSGSLAGKLLHALVGYTDRPSGMQVLAYLATLAAILGGMRLATPRPPARPGSIALTA